METRLTRGGATVRVQLHPDGTIRLIAEDGSIQEARVESSVDGRVRVTTDRRVHLDAAREGDTVWVRFEGRTYRFEAERGRRRKRSRGGGDLASPMPGQVQALLVKAGDHVEAQQPLLVVEAMKMQLEIKAPRAGTVKRFLAAPGDQITAGAPLAELVEES